MATLKVQCSSATDRDTKLAINLQKKIQEWVKKHGLEDGSISVTINQFATSTRVNAAVVTVGE